jgi:DNA-binding response OmpR family regulator
VDKLLNYTVLFVEDDDAIRQKVTVRLKSYFQTVYDAKDAKEGMHLYKTHAIDILFLDIDLPQMSGLEFLEIIRKTDYNVKAVMITAHSDKKFLLKASELKLSKYIVKPLSRKNLEDAVRKVTAEITSYQIVPKQMINLPYGFIWDTQNKELEKSGAKIRLTPSEKNLLALLIEHPNKVFSYDEIIINLWDDYESDKMSVLKTIVKTLRKKTYKELITNIYGEGFKANI